jgi:hypothetical protein
MNEQQTKDVICFFNKCNIIASTFNQLNGMLIPREILLDNETYKTIKDDIVSLKKMFNSSSLTSLQSTAETNQKWPLLNLIRQLLKAINFKLTPKRVSAGYTKTGTKLYKRMFIIERFNQTELLVADSDSVFVTSPDVGTVSSLDLDTTSSGVSSIGDKSPTLPE